MQFYSPIPNSQPQQLNGYNTYNPPKDLDAYLNDQAIQFAQKQFQNAQPSNTRHQFAVQPRMRTCQDLKISPLYSDDVPVKTTRQYNDQKVIQLPDDMDLDQYLTQQAEEFARANLRVHSDNSLLYAAQQVQYTSPYINNKPGVGANQLAQQPVHYYVQQPQPQPQPQPQQVRQVRQQVQRVQQAQPQYVQNFAQKPQTQQYIQVAQPRQNELVLPSPVIRQEQFNPYLAQQTGQAQVASTNAEKNLQSKMEFMKKGPRGEALYKVQEGGVNYYVKRGLTPEAVCNYNLAHIIGVGPPVEILGSDGVKMEEGVCMRQAIKEKMISVDEAFKQVQKLHNTLYDAGMAHCDVKFENCLYFPRHGKVLLIDNGDLATYGNKRTIKTAGANSTMIIAPTGYEERNRVGPATDLRGFMHIMMNAINDEH